MAVKVFSTEDIHEIVKANQKHKHTFRIGYDTYRKLNPVGVHMSGARSLLHESGDDVTVRTPMYLAQKDSNTPIFIGTVDIPVGIYNHAVDIQVFRDALDAVRAAGEKVLGEIDNGKEQRT